MTGNNAFKDGELDKDSVVKEYLTTAGDGKSVYNNQLEVDKTRMCKEIMMNNEKLLEEILK